MDYQTILVAEEEPLAIITLNRTDALNALNGKMVYEITEALSSFETRDSIRCVILTGSDRVFCAGADIKEMSSQSAVGMIKSDHLLSLWEKVGRYPKPIIAALSGYTFGGGLELA